MTSSPGSGVDAKTLIFFLSLKKMPIKVEISITLSFKVEASVILLNVKKIQGYFKCFSCFKISGQS